MSIIPHTYFRRQRGKCVHYMMDNPLKNIKNHNNIHHTAY